MIDVAAKSLEIFVGDPEPGLGEVADDADDAILADPPAVTELGEAALGALSHEHVDRALALEQQLDQVSADETGRSGYEVAHSSPPRLRIAAFGPYYYCVVTDGV